MFFYIEVFTSRFTTTMFKFLFKEKKKVSLSIPVFICICEALTAFIVTAGFGFWLVSAGRVVTVPAMHFFISKYLQVDPTHPCPNQGGKKKKSNTLQHQICVQKISQFHQ